MWETGFIRQLSASQTFHVFAAPPTKVYVPRTPTSFFHNILISVLDSILGAVRTSCQTFLTATSHIYKRHRLWLLDTRVCKVMARMSSSLYPALKHAYLFLCWRAFRTASSSVSEISITFNTCLLHFAGLDLVPLHPDLSHLRSSDLDSRITWMQSNW